MINVNYEYFCDRCKESYEPYEDIEHQDGKPYGSFAVSTLSTNGDMCTRPIRNHLCQDCKDSFYDWLFRKTEDKDGEQ